MLQPTPTIGVVATVVPYDHEGSGSSSGRIALEALRKDSDNTCVRRIEEGSPSAPAPDTLTTRRVMERRIVTRAIMTARGGQGDLSHPVPSAFKDDGGTMTGLPLPIPVGLGTSSIVLRLIEDAPPYRIGRP